MKLVLQIAGGILLGAIASAAAWILARAVL